MRVFLTGGGGMLGRTLRARWAGRHELSAPTRAELDLSDAGATAAAIEAFGPEVVVHSAAFTRVDDAETDPDGAFLGNAEVSANVARASHRVGARIIALSTDYVFSGTLERPHHEWDPTGPRTVYGASKLGAEAALRAHAPDHTIVRTAWLYGAGGPSFLHTVARLAATRPGPLRMVDDQIGNPTSCEAVAGALDGLLEDPIPGVVHGTCEGETSWFGFAKEVVRLLGADVEIEPCTTAAFPRPASRPANSRLENRRLRLRGHPKMPHWQDALRIFVERHRSELSAFGMD